MEILHTSRNQRLRRCTTIVDEFSQAALPRLNAVQTELLIDWLKSSDASQRRWQTLLDLAGIARLELARELAEVLCQAGWVTLIEKREHQQWQISRLQWMNLPSTQAQSGVANQAEKQVHKERVKLQLQHLAQEHPWLNNAAQQLLTATPPVTTLIARYQLLQALLQWSSEQRYGLRQDFALIARNDTKGISSTAWDWMAEHIDLEGLGIERFAPIIWIAGDIGFEHTEFGTQCSPRGLNFIGLPSRQLQAPWRITKVPELYWLIENRASFERQASKLDTGVCLIWLPGRPSSSWQETVTWLLSQAPAPAKISCDPDPAGIDIAMTAGEIWNKSGLAWQPHQMGIEESLSAKPKALNGYDQSRLKQLIAQTNLPQPLYALCLYMLKTQTKSEQEGWL